MFLLLAAPLPASLPPSPPGVSFPSEMDACGLALKPLSQGLLPGNQQLEADDLSFLAA